MPRTSRLGLALALLLVIGTGTWWLLRPDAPYPRTDRVATLQDTAEVRWAPNGFAAIDASDPLDALTTLGYVHGMTRGWTITLWRQTARGRLSRWFGSGILRIDRHARRLAFARQAQSAFQQLSSSQKRRLRAYAQGLNTALQSARVRQQDAFVLHEVTPAPWKPWHTLAVERLLAWLGTKPLSPPSGAPSALARFHKNDQLLRRWLHLHGWGRSVAWATHEGPSDSAGTVLFQRHVLGASATPIMQEVTVSTPTNPHITGATLPGLPLMPTGTQDGTAWASLLRSSARFQDVAFDSTEVRRRHERLSPINGDEQLLEIRRLSGRLLFDTTRTQKAVTSRPPAPPDTTPPSPPPKAWVLQWSGFSTASDIPAWLDRAGLAPTASDSASFQLFEADGLRVSQAGEWHILGSPSVVVRDSANSRVLVGQSSWAHHQAQSLSAHHRSGHAPTVRRWSASDSSTWAARLLPRMTPALDRLSSTHPTFQNVVTYLQNWDYTYSATSIGATLFDQWMQAYRSELGRLPVPRDTAYFATYRQHRALLRALDTLRARLGPDVRRWRWERTVPDRRFFPVWSADSLVNADLQNLRSTRYAPLQRSGRGHPSALSGGPSLVDPPPTAPSPSTWEGWTRSADQSLTVRRYHYDPTTTFARSRMRRARPSPVRLSADSTQYTTTLHPAPP